MPVDFANMSMPTRMVVFFIIGAVGAWLGIWPFHSKTYFFKSPGKARSVCLERDVDKLCTCWSLQGLSTLADGANGDVGGFAERCVHAGGSAKFDKAMDDGGVVFKCVTS